MNQTTRQGYDDFNHPTHGVDALGFLTKTTYDLADNRVALVDPIGNPWAYNYDGLNRLLKETDPLNAARTFLYDSGSNLLKTTDRNNRERVFAYDKLNRRTNEYWKTGGSTDRTMTFAYDLQNNLLSATDKPTGGAEAQLTYQYDKRNRMTASTQYQYAAVGVPTVVFSQTFNAADDRLTLSATLGGTQDFRTTYTYDLLGRMTLIQQGDDTSVAKKRVDLTYNALDQLKQVVRDDTLAGGSPVGTTTYDYDGAARLGTITHVQGALQRQATLAYDTADRITRFDSYDGTSTYVYDATGQLTSADHSYQTDESYTYDANGNRTMSGYTTGTGNRLTADGVYTYSYDGEGNRSQRTKTSNSTVTDYVWDHRNRLTEVIERVTPTGTITKHTTYSYDVFNRRVGKSVDAGSGVATVTRFVYDGAHIALVYSGTSGSLSLKNRYLHGPMIDQVFADEQLSGGGPGTVLWALTDHQGTVRDLVNNVGSVQKHLSYDAFGKITTDSAPSVEHAFAFTGREWDAESGQYYYRNRYYDASPTGRFLSEDPIGFVAGDSNMYRYVSNIPTSATDPQGLWRVNIRGIIGPLPALFGPWVDVSFGTGGFGLAAGIGIKADGCLGNVSVTLNNTGTKPAPGTGILGIGGSINYATIILNYFTVPAPPPGPPLIPPLPIIPAFPPPLPAWLLWAAPASVSVGGSSSRFGFYLFGGVQII